MKTYKEFLAAFRENRKQFYLAIRAIRAVGRVDCEGTPACPLVYFAGNPQLSNSQLEDAGRILGLSRLQAEVIAIAVDGGVAYTHPRTVRSLRKQMLAIMEEP